jgi:hypothetical protein
LAREAADTGQPVHKASNMRKALQQIKMVKNGVAESFGYSGKIRPGVSQDLFEIRYRGFCDSNLEIH